MNNSRNKKLILVRFCILYLASLALLIIIFSAFVRPAPTILYKEKKPAVDVDHYKSLQRISREEAELRKEIIALSRVDSLYIELSGSHGSQEQLLSLGSARRNQENMVREKLDQFSEALPNYSNEEKERRSNIKLSYLPVLSSRKPVDIPVKVQPMEARSTADKELIDRLQATVTEKDRQLSKLAASKETNGNDRLLRLENELNTKNNRLKALESQVSNAKTRNTTEDDDATIKDLERRNKNLADASYSLMTQVGVLTKNYNIVKKENVALQRELTSLKQNNTAK